MSGRTVRREDKGRIKGWLFARPAGKMCAVFTLEAAMITTLVRARLVRSGGTSAPEVKCELTPAPMRGR